MNLVRVGVDDDDEDEDEFLWAVESPNGGDDLPEVLDVVLLRWSGEMAAFEEGAADLPTKGARPLPDDMVCARGRGTGEGEPGLEDGVAGNGMDGGLEDGDLEGCDNPNGFRALRAFSAVLPE